MVCSCLLSPLYGGNCEIFQHFLNDFNKTSRLAKDWEGPLPIINFITGGFHFAWGTRRPFAHGQLLLPPCMAHRDKVEGRMNFQRQLIHFTDFTKLHLRKLYTVALGCG